MKIQTRIIKDVDIAIREITEGNVVALPAETVYGLGANALNEKAVLKIFETKERPKFNPLIVHIYSKDDFDKYGINISEKVYMLAEKFSPGAITFIVRKKSVIPYIVTSGNDSVALRMPSHPVFREVLRQTSLPISAPSANRFGKISPTSAEEVLKELNGKIKYILDGGKSDIGIESTVISFLEEEPQILRNGYITKEEIVKIIGNVTDNLSNKFISPGSLKSHYAPSTPLYVTNSLHQYREKLNGNIGFLDLGKYSDVKIMASNLFSDLRKLDEKKYDFIICEMVDNRGLGKAINERLMKASSGTAEIIHGKLSIIKK